MRHQPQTGPRVLYPLGQQDASCEVKGNAEWIHCMWHTGMLHLGSMILNFLH